MTDADSLAATRQMWSLGSDATMGDVLAAAGQDLVATVGAEGLDVLDVACGTGNTALAAARAGARHVTGVDMTPALLAEAARRAESSGLTDRVTWHESDMADLPVDDDAFDRVLSSFGAMFATDQRRVAGAMLPAIFGVAPEAIRFDERILTWRASSADAAMTVCEESAPPIITLRQGLGDRWAAARAEVVALFRAHGTEDADGIDLPLTYTIATFAEP